MVDHIIEDISDTIGNQTGENVKSGISTDGWWIIGVNRNEIGWIYLHISSNFGEHRRVASRLEAGHIVVSLLNNQQAVDTEDIWLWFELLREDAFEKLDELILRRTGQYAMPVYDQTGEVGRKHRASIRRHAKLYLTHNGFEEVNATDALSGISSGIAPSSVLFSVKRGEELIIFCNCDAKNDDYHLHYINGGTLSNPRNSNVASDIASEIGSRLSQRESLSETMRGLSGRAKLTAIFGGLSALSLLGATAIGWLFDSLNSTFILRIFQLGLSISAVIIIVSIGYPIFRDQMFTWDIRPWYRRRLKLLISIGILSIMSIFLVVR
jgi:hypothetical protein